MQSTSTTGLQTPERTEAPIPDKRVTARIVRSGDGKTQTLYCAGGRVYGSLAALKTALGGDQR